MGFLACERFLASRLRGDSQSLWSGPLWVPGSWSPSFTDSSHLPQSPLQCLSLKGVQLALQEVGVGSISICQESQGSVGFAY